MMVSFQDISLDVDEGHECPRVINCSQSSDSGQHLVSFDIGRAPSYVAIVSSALSCLGSILIFVAFLVLRDLRTGAQKIITFLALADFISAAGYIVGSSNFLTSFNVENEDKCKKFQLICEIQASITSWSSLCSFAWTLILAFYFYLVIVYDRRSLAVKLLPLYHFLAWVVPLFIIVPLAALRKLGYAPYAASNWCYVKGSGSVALSGEIKVVLFILVAGKFWEIATYCVVVFVYAHTVYHISKLKRRRRDYLPIQAVNVIEQAEKRLIYIPVFFIVLRIWGTLEFFFAIGVSGENHDGCIPSGIQIAFLAFGIIQAIGDPGQGWGNAILYVLLSPVVRERLYTELCSPCMDRLEAIGRTLLPDAQQRSNEQDGNKSRSTSQSGSGGRGEEGRLSGINSATLFSASQSSTKYDKAHSPKS